MALITENAAPVFDREQVMKGDLIRAKHTTWEDYRNGVVVSVSDERLVVFYYAGYGNVCNHYVIKATEVEAGEWSVKWSHDLETIYSEVNAEGGNDGSDVEGENTGG